MAMPPRTIQDNIECAYLLGRDAKRIADDLDRHRRSESDPHRLSEMHRLRMALIDFSNGMGHIEVRLREIGVIK